MANADCARLNRLCFNRFGIQAIFFVFTENEIVAFVRLQLPQVKEIHVIVYYLCTNAILSHPFIDISEVAFLNDFLAFLL